MFYWMLHLGFPGWGNVSLGASTAVNFCKEDIIYLWWNPGWNSFLRMLKAGERAQERTRSCRMGFFFLFWSQKEIVIQSCWSWKVGAVTVYQRVSYFSQLPSVWHVSAHEPGAGITNFQTCALPRLTATSPTQGQAGEDSCAAPSGGVLCWQGTGVAPGRSQPADRTSRRVALVLEQHCSNAGSRTLTKAK